MQNELQPYLDERENTGELESGDNHPAESPSTRAEHKPSIVLGGRVIWVDI